MKCVGVQYVEALRTIFASTGTKPFLRTVHILWGPGLQNSIYRILSNRMAPSFEWHLQLYDTFLGH